MHRIEPLPYRGNGIWAEDKPDTQEFHKTYGRGLKTRKTDITSSVHLTVRHMSTR